MTAIQSRGGLGAWLLCSMVLLASCGGGGTVVDNARSNANLQGLVLSAGIVDPAFSAAVTAYTASVAHEVNTVTVAPTAAGTGAVITVQNVIVGSGTASAPIALAVGANTIVIAVTAPDGSTKKEYRVVVTRQAGTNTNADLASLELTTGTLTPVFDPSVTSYEGELSDSGETVAVTATSANSGSTIRVQDQDLLSGATTAPISVRPATMSLRIDVDAADGLTHKTYTVIVRLRGWQLNETNTGLAGAGIDKNTLPVYDGPLVGGIWHEPPSGTVISLKRIDHALSLKNGNITIDRCWIRPTTLLPASFAYTFDFNNGDPAPDISTIIDSDIDGSLPTDQEVAGQCGVDGLATVQRTNLFGMGTGIAIFAYGLNKDITIEQNYVHDLRKYGDTTTGSHNESFTIRGFVGSSLQIRNNRFISKTGNDSGAIFIQPYADAIDNTLIDGNLLETNGWCIPLMTQNHDYGTNMRATNNRFVRLGYGPGYVQGGPGWAQWTDNCYDDPSEPFHKGDVIAQPR